MSALAPPPERPDPFPEPTLWRDPASGELKLRHCLGGVINGRLQLEPKRSNAQCYGWNLYVVVPRGGFDGMNCTVELYALMDAARSLLAISRKRPTSKNYLFIQHDFVRGFERYYCCGLAPARYVIDQLDDCDLLYQVAEPDRSPLRKAEPAAKPEPLAGSRVQLQPHVILAARNAERRAETGEEKHRQAE